MALSVRPAFSAGGPVAGACAQLIADTAGTVEVDTVRRYYAGRAEVSSFAVADLAVEGRTAYVVCKAGGRSAKVAQLLAHHGYEPINVNGGMLAWAEAGRRVIAADGGPGTI